LDLQQIDEHAAVVRQRGLRTVLTTMSSRIRRITYQPWQPSHTAPVPQRIAETAVPPLHRPTPPCSCSSRLLRVRVS
jgi:hypothetical protein